MNEQESHGIDHAHSVKLLAWAAFASMASMRVCDPMLPRLAETLHVTTGQAAHTISAFAIAYGVLQLFYGYLGERYGKLRVILVATLACTVGSAGAALAPSLGWLTFARALTGATAAGIIPVSIAWIGDAVPYHERQATLARLLSGSILGIIAGQLLGGVFADTLGWRYAFAALALLYVVVSALLWRDLPSAVRDESERARMAVARSNYPAQIVAVLRLRWVRVVLITVALEGMALFGALAFVPYHLHTALGVSLAAAGAIMSFFGLGGLVYTLSARQLIARLGERGLARVGAALTCVALLLLLAAPTWWLALPACVLAGLGFYMLHNTLQVNASQMAPQQRSTGVALFATFLFLGQSLGVVLAAPVVDSAGPRWVFATSALVLLMLGWCFAQAIKRHARSTGACPR